MCHIMACDVYPACTEKIYIIMMNLTIDRPTIPYGIRYSIYDLTANVHAAD